MCCGVAMAARIDQHPRRVYCVMGDGEQQEGQIWEASMFAAHYKLDNLCGIIDYNRKQIDGDVEDIMGIKPLGRQVALVQLERDRVRRPRHARRSCARSPRRARTRAARA